MGRDCERRAGFWAGGVGFGAQKSSKTIVFYNVFVILEGLLSEVVLRGSWGRSWRLLGRFLGPSWGHFGAPEGQKSLENALFF